MSLSLHTLQTPHRKNKKRRGRGNSSGIGAYSGKGIKGQRARSSGHRGITRRSLKAFYLKVPKLKGFASRYGAPRTVNILDLERHFKGQDTIRITDFYKKGFLSSTARRVKLLGQGKINRPVTVFVHGISATARAAIEKAGGKIILVQPEEPAKKEAREETSKKS